MPMDMNAMMAGGDDEEPKSPLDEALDQIRDLCDQIESQQLVARKNKPAAPPADDAAPAVEAE